MTCWAHILKALEEHGRCAMVTVARVEGSAPREEGARLILTPAGFLGTIGGGALEWRALAEAQTRLGGGRSLTRSTHALGPELGQCCGGRVELLTEIFDRSVLDEVRSLAAAEAEGPFTAEGHVLSDRIARTVLKAGARSGAPLVEHFGKTRRPLCLFGAGHVGRALVLALAPLPFAIRWIDTRALAFPAATPVNAVPVQAASPVAELDSASRGAFILVMTHSHALDLAIVEAALRADRFPYVGLIGSASKRARFVKRLRDGGIAEGGIAALKCPIGIAGIASKEPAIIAAATVAEMLARDEVLNMALNPLAQTQTPSKMAGGKGASG